MDKLTYLGHASLCIETSEGKIIYIDPYAGDDADYERPADLILVTHDHYDHNEISKVKNRATDVKIITEREALKDGAHQSFHLGFADIEAVEAGYNKFHDETKCVGYIITLTSGVKLYVAGDTTLTPQMNTFADRNIDYAFFPMEGIYTMTPEEATIAASKVQAKHSIPYHTDANSNEINHATVDKFTADNKFVIEKGETINLGE